MKHPDLIYIVPATRWSGVERYVLDLARHFAAKGWRVDIISRDARAVDSLLRKPGIHIHHAPLGDWWDFGSTLTLARILRGRRQSVDSAVIHVNRYRDALRAIMARKLARRPETKVVMTAHYVRRGSDSPLYKWIYRRIDRHIFVSDIALRSFMSTWRGRRPPFDTTRMLVIHNSLNLPENHLSTDPPRQSQPTAMYHGRLAQGKGLETLLRAFAIVIDSKVKLRLRIVGTGNPDYADKLRRLADRLCIRDRIDWTRHTPDPTSYIRQSDFGVLPSSEPEAFGLANLEYMAEQRPQVCTSNGAQPEYLTDGVEAFLVPPEDPEALAAAMQRLATDQALRTEMGRNARLSFSNRLAWPAFALRMESEVY